LPGEQVRRPVGVGPARDQHQVRPVPPPLNPTSVPLQVDSAPPPDVVRFLQVHQPHNQLEAQLAGLLFERHPTALRPEAERPMV